MNACEKRAIHNNCLHIATALSWEKTIMLIFYDPNNKSKCNQTMAQGGEPPVTGNVQALTFW